MTAKISCMCVQVGGVCLKTFVFADVKQRHPAFSISLKDMQDLVHKSSEKVK